MTEAPSKLSGQRNNAPRRPVSAPLHVDVRATINSTWRTARFRGPASDSSVRRSVGPPVFLDAAVTATIVVIASVCARAMNELMRPGRYHGDGMTSRRLIRIGRYCNTGERVVIVPHARRMKTLDAPANTRGDYFRINTLSPLPLKPIHTIISANSRFGDRAFAAAGPRLYNSLPVHIRRPALTLDNFF